MSGLAKWKIHGPVETLRTEFATWDLKQEDWQPVKHFTVTSFRPDGTVSTSEFHYSDGSVVHTRWLYDDVGRLTEVNSWFNDGPIGRVVYFYDEAGRHVRTVQLSHIGTQTDSEICSYDAGGKRTKVHFLGLPGLNTFIGDTDRGYGSPGATMMTVTYDEKDLPTKVLFQDAKHNPLRYVIYVRDSAGRLLTRSCMLVETLCCRILSRKLLARRSQARRTYTIPGAGFSNRRIERAALVKNARPIVMTITMIPLRQRQNIEIARRPSTRMGPCTTLQST